MQRARTVVIGVVLPLILSAVTSCASSNESASSAKQTTSASSPSASSPAATTTATTTTSTTTSSSSSTTTTQVSTSTTLPRPPGPAADVSEELTAGAGVFLGSALGAGLGGTGYVEHEFVAAGTATSYRADGPLSTDGRWTFSAATDATADYRTRVVVRRPEHASDFSGTVVVEWLNVSGGIDADPDYATLREDIIRNGDAWVGVSAQLLGISGGPVLVSASGASAVAGKGLRSIDPVRYGSLLHPGDGYSFDIFTQVARAVREGGSALGDLHPDVVIAAGDSQSAFALTTYIDGVQPMTHAFDGFFVHSRGSVALPLVGPGEFADLARGLGTGTALFRDDTDVPIIELQAESDVTGILNSFAARQPDTERFRLWEVAGTAHADVHLVGPFSASMNCGVQINNGPLHIVAKAAYRGLVNWIRTGVAPPTAPLLEVSTEGPPTVQRDADGIALGGIRTPPVDVPIDVLSGNPGPTPSLICLLLGSTTPLPADRLAELYPTVADYTTAYAASVEAAIAAGYALADDRDALAAFAEPSRIAG